MRVQLLDFTGKGREDEGRYAAHLLVFTKSTRLNLSPELWHDVEAMTDGELLAELDYMSKTIPSSWEFVDMTFLVSGISRPCAQQMTRTRTASFAMQSQRVTNVSDALVYNPCKKASDQARFDRAADIAMESYEALLDHGTPPEDARGILPQNVTCNLVAKYNLRSFVDLVLARRSLRTQSEYAEVVDEMVKAVLFVWPWAGPFFEPRHAKAIEILEGVVRSLGMTTGAGPGWDIAKAIDLLRKD